MLNEKELKLSGIASAAAVVEREETKLSGIASPGAVVERERDELFGHSPRLPLWSVSYTHLDVYKRQG